MSDPLYVDVVVNDSPIYVDVVIDETPIYVDVVVENIIERIITEPLQWALRQW